MMQHTPPPLPSLLREVANVRDLGGIACTDGRKVRRGRLFRAGVITTVGGHDAAVLAAMGLRSICDLRRPFERRHLVSLWHDGTGARVFHTAGSSRRTGADSAILRHLKADPTEAGGIAAMIDAYATMPAAFAPLLAELFAALDQPDATPMLIHCHAGKDRTGFVCALILLALGVSHADVVADYLLTTRYLGPDAVLRVAAGLSGRDNAALAVPRVALEPVAGVRPEYLQAALDTIDRTHGSLAGYMEQLQVTPARAAQLRDLLTA